MYPRMLALALALALLTAGCLSIDVTHTVNRDGSSFITEKLDLSNIPGGTVYGTDPEDLCEEIVADNPGVGCSYEEGTLTLNRTIMPEENQYHFNKELEFPYSVYTLELRKMPAIVGQKTSRNLGQDVSDVNDFKDSSAKKIANMLKTADVELGYSIVMPGELVSVENGKISVDSKGKMYADYDVVDLMAEGEYMVVQSKELDLIAIGTVAGAAALLIGGIVVVVVLRKAMERKRKGGFGR